MPEKTRVAAYGVLVEAQGILLCRLSSIVTHAVGRWTLPGGGVEFGEAPARAVEREVQEETGLRVRTDALMHVQSKLVKLPEILIHSVQIIYRVTLAGPPDPLRHEVGGSTDLCAFHPLSAAERLPLVDVSRWALDQVNSGAAGRAVGQV